MVCIVRVCNVAWHAISSVSSSLLFFMVEKRWEIRNELLVEVVDDSSDIAYPVFLFILVAFSATTRGPDRFLFEV